ncbi:MAG: hypothetical protein KU38_07720 [Sulfurovum sp. FS08-3]|nr:MAG: hypothetical protein KU38_07720 [Sulfurovum sp. FS08-3]
MSEHFIREIEIKNYKLFQDFKAEGFGRVNLIGGKNNVGKTAFMEACVLAVAKNTKQLYYNILVIDTIRNTPNIFIKKSTPDEGLNDLLDNKNDFELMSNLGKSFISKGNTFAICTQNVEVEMNIDALSNFIKSNIGLQLKYAFSNVLLSSHMIADDFLKVIIGELKLRKKYSLLNQYLSEIFAIDLVDIINDKVYIQVDDEFKPLSNYGMGVKSFINIIAALLFPKENANIFIDEIENGIHYTNLDKLWEIILTVSKDQNVQVFATTHSKECIESYNRVQRKLDESDTYYFEMIKNIKTEKVFMRKLDSHQLEYELTHKGEFRG